MRCSVPLAVARKLDLATGVAKTTPDDATPALCPDANFTIAQLPREEPAVESTAVPEDEDTAARMESTCNDASTASCVSRNTLANLDARSTTKMAKSNKNCLEGSITF